MAPKYTAQLFEQNIFGALEDQRLPINQVSTLLNFGNTRYILLNKNLYDYQQYLPEFSKYNWHQSSADSNFLLLENFNYSGPITVHPPNSAKIISWQRPSPNIITTQVKVETKALIIASESWYPGWQVLVDNKPKPLLKANSAFLGVEVSRGNHNITFQYIKPWYYAISSMISLISLGLFTLIISKP